MSKYLPRRHVAHGTALQGLRLQAQGPAQGFAQAQGLDARTSDAIDNAAAGDFDLGQFGHGHAGPDAHRENGAGIMMQA